MMEDVEGGKRKALAPVAGSDGAGGAAGCGVVPPMVSINRYKNDISTWFPSRWQAGASFFGRASAHSKARLCIDGSDGRRRSSLWRGTCAPRNAVKASIRLFSLWRGRLEISRISVDEASINLVAHAEGRWNWSRFSARRQARYRTRRRRSESNRRVNPFPYIEATNSGSTSRKALRNCFLASEHRPFVLAGAAGGMAHPGARTASADGCESRFGRYGLSFGLRQAFIARRNCGICLFISTWIGRMRTGPTHAGCCRSDSGWRGDLTGEMHLDGTETEAAQIQTRLRATGVHREEFAPAAPMDFDASCGLCTTTPTFG